MHRLLERQIRKLTKNAEKGEPDRQQLLDLISATYEEMDHERRLRDRSIQLMSDELLESNRKIRERSDAFISTILQNIVDGVFTLDAKGIIRSANHAALRIFGLKSGDQLQGIPFWELFTGKTAENIRSTVLQMPETRSQQTLEAETNKKGNTGISLEMTISKTNLDDQPLRIVIVRDISLRKQTEKALIEARDKAEEATLSKARFLSTMSHEIRTPLNAVIGTVNLLYDTDPRADQLEYLDILRFSSQNLLALINDILDLSKMESGRVIADNSEFELKKLVNEIGEAFRPQVKRKAIHLELDLDPEIPRWLRGDPVRLGQILNNLVSNAIKFTHEGCVKVSVRRQKSYRNSITLKFSVEDTGIGIAEQYQDKIFEVFSQEHTDSDKLYGGTGLGLSITRQLVELLGGAISLTSKKDEGSRFDVELPFEIVEQQGEDQLFNEGEKCSLAGKKILVVEDNKVNRFVVLKFLRKWEVIADYAENGMDALDKIRSGSYDLVLMDLQMPVMNGYQTAERIRSIDDPKRSSLPIVALTASAMLEIREKVFRVGMNDYIAKPFSPEELKETILRNLEDN